MRPISLTLEGFVSFVDRTEVDFSEFDLFAITGPTGSGKTSLLDALTWALYGRTTRLGKTAIDLISHGVNKVVVHLEFAAGGHRYRVARTAKRSGSPQIRLEKYAGDWTPVDASGSAETNEAVCRIVGLDFEAFTRSVILPQGKFDAFLRGEHKDRREILKTLLGLEVYDRMRDLAVQKRDRLRADEEARRGVIERDFANATDENLKTLRTDLRQARKQQKDNASLAKRAEQLRNTAQELRLYRNSLAEKQGYLVVAEEDYLSECEVASQRSSQVDKIRQAIERGQEEVGAIVIDDALYARLVTLKERAATLAQLEESRRGAFKSEEKVRGELNVKGKELDVARKSATQAEIARTAASSARDQARKLLDQSLASGSADLLENLAETVKTIPSRREALAILGRLKIKLAGDGKSWREQIVNWKSACVVARTALKKTRDEQEHLTVQNTHRGLRAGLNKGEPCPVCEQIVKVLPKVPAVGALESVKALVKKSEEELQQIQNAIAKAENELDRLPNRLRENDSHVLEATKTLEGITKRVYAVTGELSDSDCLIALNRTVASIRNAQKALKKSEEELGAAQSATQSTNEKVVRLDKSVTGLSERLAGIDEELGRLALRIGSIRPEIEKAGGGEQITSSLKAITDAKRKREELAAGLKKLDGDLQAAEANKSTAEQGVAVLNERKKGLIAEIDRLKDAIAKLSELWVSLESGFDLLPGQDEADRAEKKLRMLEDERIRITDKIVRIDATAKEIETKMAQLVDLQKELEEVRSGRSIYEQLASALRADRFIEYLLETTYSNLCEKGSEYLMLLSQERYSFTASKNEFCVKDGWNGDAERSASTLSGGESFLASLALALALADSVASFAADGSAGAQLEALFLDEGVSTLDQDETLPTVIDALISLQTGDRLIGVISHMENLAERLPARIEILKNKGRSSIRTMDAIMQQSM